MKKLAMLTLAGALVAVPALGQTGIDVTQHRKAVAALLAEKAVNLNRVEKIVVEPVYNNQGPITDVMAFVHMKKCDDGYLVVRLDRAGKVMQSYTRNHCQVDGFPNYQ